MTNLSVNLNKIALLRNARSGNIPKIQDAVRIVLEAGAHGITVHPRPDQRHIRYQDVLSIAELLQNEFPQKEFNVEGNPFEGAYLDLIEKVCPTQCTLVPDKPEQSTSDHGWKPENIEKLKPIIKKIKKKESRVSLFMDPKPEWILQIGNTGVDRIELYTENFAKSFSKHAGEEKMKKEMKKEMEETTNTYIASAQVANKIGFGINAGHDLDRYNLHFLVEHIPEIIEVSIGHALICDSIFWGLEKTVKEYLVCLSPN